MLENGEELAIKIGKGAGWLFFGVLIAETIAFFYRIVLARWLQPYEYGLFSLVLMMIGFGTTFFTLGLPQALTKFIAEYRAKNLNIDALLSTALIFTILSGMASTAIFFLLAEPLALHIFKNIDAVLPLKIGSLALLFVLIGNVFNAALQGWQKMKYSALGTITDRLVKFIASLILLWFGFGLLGVTFALLICYATLALLLALLYKKVAPISISKFDQRIGRLLTAFGLPMFITGIAGIFLGWTDSLMIGHFMSEEWVGYYNAALPILWILGLAISSLAAMLFPTFSELKAKKSVYTERTLNRSLKYAFYLLIPSSIGGFLLAGPIIDVLFGQAYLPAMFAFQILVFGALFLGLRSITDSYLMGMGKPKIISMFAIGAAIANAAMNWWFVQWWGIEGAALATTTSLAVIFALSVSYVRKFTKLSFGYLPKTVLATAIMAIVVWLIRISAMTSIEKIVLIVISGIAVYFGVLYLIGGFDGVDKKIIKKIFS